MTKMVAEIKLKTENSKFIRSDKLKKSFQIADMSIYWASFYQNSKLRNNLHLSRNVIPEFILNILSNPGFSLSEFEQNLFVDYFDQIFDENDKLFNSGFKKSDSPLKLRQSSLKVTSKSLTRLADLRPNVRSYATEYVDNASVSEISYSQIYSNVSISEDGDRSEVSFNFQNELCTPSSTKISNLIKARMASGKTKIKEGFEIPEESEFDDNADHGVHDN